MKRIEKLNKWSKLSDKDKSDKIVNEMDWTEKDQKSLRLLEPSLTRLSEAAANYPGLSGLSPPALQYRWMLEEFRVSLFAQQLGTRLPVSSKRLDEQWQKVRNWLNENPR